MSAARIDFQTTPPSGGIWHSLNRFLFTLIVLTVAALIGYRFLPEVSKRREQQERVEQLKVEVEKERQILVLNTRKKELLNYDAEYLGLVGWKAYTTTAREDAAYTLPFATVGLTNLTNPFRLSCGAMSLFQSSFARFDASNACSTPGVAGGGPPQPRRAAG